MSLIAEALKRARVEAARREAAERGARYPSLPVHTPATPATRAWPMAVAIGVLVGALGAAVLWLWLRPPAPPPAEAGSRTAAAAATPGRQDAPPASAHVAPVVEPPGALTVGRPAVEPSTAASPAAPGLGPPPGALPAAPAEDAPAAATAEPRPAPLASPAPPTPTRAATAPAGSHLRRVELPGGVRIELSGIAWSEDFPVALLNGQALAAGERVAGYTVARIEPAAVELRGPEGTIILRLK